MRNRLKAISMFLALSMVVFFASVAGAAKMKLSFDHYYDEAEVYRTVKSFASHYPDLVKVRSIGKSEEGRDIWLITINNPKTGRDTEKPGVYIDGAIHGNEIQATEACLYMTYYLLDQYDKLPKIKKLIDSRAFYIIPTVNVDHRARFFSDPGGYNIGRTAMVPYDDDRDGLVDEDNYDDLDKDGEIVQMRIKDPYGDWKTHPDDPRVMVRVKPGEKGEWTLLGSEGIDNDGDGRLNEDVPGYLDMNRNYGFKWQPPYVQRGSGDFPMSGKVTKAVADFVMTKPNLCFNFALHNTGGLIVRGPGSKLAGIYPASDVAVYDFLGKEAERIIPGYRYIIGGKEMYTTHGDFDEWMFSNLGVYGYVLELFTAKKYRYRGEKEKPEEESGPSWFSGASQIERQKFNDNVTQGAMFKNWKKFKHPQFGEIELGGWKKFTNRMPPPFLLLEEVHRITSVMIFVAQHTPQVKLELIDVKKLKGDLVRIRVRAANTKAMPTLSANALRRNVYRRDMLVIEGEGIEVVSGAVVRDLHMNRINPVKNRPRMIFTHVPGFGSREVQWIVKGKGKVTVKYVALKAKNKKITFKL